MHVEFRRVAGRSRHARAIWFFRWGFGLWLGRLLFSIGHDTRSRTVTTKPCCAWCNLDAAEHARIGCVHPWEA